MMNIKKLTPTKLVLELLMLVVVLAYLVPIWMVAVNSLKSAPAASFLNLALPAQWLFENYAYVIENSSMVKGLFNGVFIGSCTVLLQILFSSMASFYFARANKRLSNFVHAFFLAGLIIPGSVIPVYLVMRSLHLTDTYAGLILLFVTGGLPFSVFLFTGFVKSLPKELDEASIIDGCKPFQLYARVIFPLLKPVTMTVGIFSFIGVWNNVTTYLYFANSGKHPLPLTIYAFFGKYSQSWNLVFADILIGIVPCLILFIAGQRFMVSGMTAGAVKG